MILHFENLNFSKIYLQIYFRKFTKFKRVSFGVILNLNIYDMTKNNVVILAAPTFVSITQNLQKKTHKKMDYLIVIYTMFLDVNFFDVTLRLIFMSSKEKKFFMEI